METKLRMSKRLLSLLLSVVMVFTLLPATVQAASATINLATVSANGTGYTWDSTNGVLTLTGSDNMDTYTITTEGVETSRRIYISTAVPLTIILDNVNINTSTGSPLALTVGGHEVLRLNNTNTLITSATDCAGIQVPDITSLTIEAGEGDAKLTVQGGYCGAGIGGGKNASGSTINIKSGTVTATGGYCGAGIGGGNNASGGTINIKSGTVTATGGDYAAGIGGGTPFYNNGTSCGAITIDGGTVNAIGGSYAAGVGGGYISSGGTVTINGGMVTAAGKDGGAGIGGGIGSAYLGKTGTIERVTICGGTVVATGGSWNRSGAGIGGGGESPGCTVNISGGSILATGGSNAENIGAGEDGSSSGSITNSENSNIYLTTVTLDGVAAETEISSLTTDPDLSYGTNDMVTDSDGKLYLYLPSGTETTAAQTTDGAATPLLKAYTGFVATTDDDLAVGTLYLNLQSLDTPTGLSWDGTIPGKATWNAVTNAASYSVQLYKDGSAQGGAITGVTAAEYVFTSAIASAGGGSYTFKVTAIGDGTSCTDSTESAASAAYVYSPATVTSAEITPDRRVFDIYNPGNVTTTITWNSASVVMGVSKGSMPLASPDSYEVSGDTLTIKQAYLENQAVSSVVLTITFDRGDPATLTIDITDSTPPSISPVSASYDLSAPGNVTTYITWNSASSVTDVVYDTASLTLDTDYTVSGNTLTVKDSYLSSLGLSEGNTLTFTITFDTNDTVTLTVDIGNNYTPSKDTQLISLKVGGITVSGFDPAKTSYNVKLPYGTQPGSAAAKVYAVAKDTKASVSVTQATSLPGSATITVTAEDGTTSLLYTVNFTLEAASGIAPTIATISLSVGTVNTAYNHALAATGDTPITWAKVNGDLPGGLSLSDTGVISGVPLTAGTFNFTVEAANATGSDTQSLSLTINAAPVQLDTPAGLAWDSTTPGKAIWSAVPNVTSYTVQLYKGGSAQGSPATGVTVTEHDFTSVIASAGSGSYTFKVTAIGDGAACTDSAVSAASAAYSYTAGVTTYTITASAGSGGSISPDGAVTVMAGDSQTFTIKPNNNYSISSVTVDSVSLGVISSYTFSNVSGNHVISAAFTHTGESSGGSSSGGGSSEAKYTVSAGKSPNGKITLSATSVYKGGSVTVTITPEDGYRIADVLINGVSVGIVSSYTIENIRKNTTVQAVFEKIEEDSPGKWENPYSDVEESAWYYDSVSYVSRKGLMNGNGEHFDPDGGMTRAMVVTVLFRLSGDYASYENTFSDVDSGAWYEQATAWALAKGIVSGVGNNSFAPDISLSREQLAVMLYNYAKYKGLDVSLTDSSGLSGYADADSISTWAENAMKWAVSRGIISGDGSNLDPDGTATRAQIAAILHRFIENMINQ